MLQGGGLAKAGNKDAGEARGFAIGCDSDSREWLTRRVQPRVRWAQGHGADPSETSEARADHWAF